MIFFTALYSQKVQKTPESVCVQSAVHFSSALKHSTEAVLSVSMVLLRKPKEEDYILAVMHKIFLVIIILLPTSRI